MNFYFVRNLRIDFQGHTSVDYHVCIFQPFTSSASHIKELCFPMDLHIYRIGRHKYAVTLKKAERIVLRKIYRTTSVRAEKDTE